MKSEGKSDYTIRNVGKFLRTLGKNVDLDYPDLVKSHISSLNTSEGYKRNLVDAYVHYLKYKGYSWIKPVYRESAKLPRIPTEEKLNMIISASPRALAIKLLVSMETGLRPVELTRLRVSDVDLSSGRVYPVTAKHGSPRVLKLSPRSVGLLSCHIASRSLRLNDLLFGGTSEDYAKSFRRIRNAVSSKLNDPSIKSIRLYDFRHFYATMLYHKSKDILYVKQQMGHKRLTTTLVYTQLIDNGNDEWVSKVATTVEEAQSLIESGFDYVTTFESKMLFRRRK